MRGALLARSSFSRVVAVRGLSSFLPTNGSFDSRPPTAPPAAPALLLRAAVLLLVLVLPEDRLPKREAPAAPAPELVVPAPVPGRLPKPPVAVPRPESGLSLLPLPNGILPRRSPILWLTAFSGLLPPPLLGALAGRLPPGLEVGFLSPPLPGSLERRLPSPLLSALLPEAEPLLLGLSGFLSPPLLPPKRDRKPPAPWLWLELLLELVELELLLELVGLLDVDRNGLLPGRCGLLDELPEPE